MRRALVIACAGLAIGALIWGLRSRPPVEEAVIEPLSEQPQVTDEAGLVDGGPTRPKVSELKLLVRNACKRGKFVGRGLEAVRRPPASPLAVPDARVDGDPRSRREFFRRAAPD